LLDAIALGGALIVASCIGFTKLGFPGLSDSPILAPVYFTASAFSFAMLLPKFCSLKPTRFIYFNRFIKYTSLISYSLYLGHIFCFMMVRWTLHQLNIYEAVYPKPWLTYSLFLVTAYIVASATYFAIERPFLVWRDKKSQSAFHPATVN
jgi:peptidoglycan/LPS O-acetylase OafA/YrhL